MTRVRLIKTTGEDLLQLAERAGVERHDQLNEENAGKVEMFPHTFSVIDVFGRVWAILGVIEYEPGKHEAWMLVDPEAGIHMLTITRLIKQGLKEHPAKEIEAYVELNFDRGHRFAGMLGFKVKAPGIAHNREGRTYAQYILSEKGEP